MCSRWHGLNLPVSPKEGGCGLYHKLAQKLSRRGREKSIA